VILDGRQLRETVARTSTAIELRNEHGRCYRTVTCREALALDLDLFVGIGNRRRVKFLRRHGENYAINAGSRTIKRMKGDSDRDIAQPLIREHRFLS
jgi:hypothetical protein